MAEIEKKGAKKNNRFVILMLVITKSAKFVKFIKVFKALKFAKFFITFISMTLSMFVYAFWLGPLFSIGFVLMLFFHEMGHVLAMKKQGMPTKAPVFIPMLGAVIFAPRFKTRAQEAFIGYGGPLAGLIATLVVFAAWLLLPKGGKLSEIILLVSYTSAFINLFNMLPIRPLDGGRVTQIVGGWFKYFAIVGLVYISFLIKEPGILLIWIIIATETNFKPTVKFATTFSIHTLMIIMMSLGYGEQGLWINLVDIVLGTVVNLLMFGQMIAYLGKQLSEEELNPYNLPTAPMALRLKWLALYFILTAALIGLMAIQVPYLPQLPSATN